MIKFIAELCQNHNGDADLLLQMAEEAAEAGATHIKIQHIYTRNLSFRQEFEQAYRGLNEQYGLHRSWSKEFERLKELELSDKVCERFVDHVKSLGLIPMTTCFARCDLGRIRDQGFEWLKIASYDCASYQMIREASSLFKNIVVSTGASFDNEIEKTANILNSCKEVEFSLLHCVTAYPTPLELMNIKRIEYLKSLCGSVGFSDHSRTDKNGLIASKVAVMCGARLIERHFTSLKENETKDGVVSVNKELLADLVRFSKLSEQAQSAELEEIYPRWRDLLGSARRGLTDEELRNRHYYRGRFASARTQDACYEECMIQNWEETLLD